MILSVRMDNFMIFDDPIELSFEANGYIKKFESNYVNTHGHKILKSSCFYGPNNVGKSSVLQAIIYTKLAMSGYNFERNIAQISNFNSPAKVARLGLTLLYKDNLYTFDFAYHDPDTDNPNGRFIYEKLSLYNEDRKQYQDIYIRDDEKKIYKFMDNDFVTSGMRTASHERIYPFAADDKADPDIKKCRDILLGLSSSIITCDNPLIAPDLTIDLLKNGDPKYTKFIKKLITDIDVGISDFAYERRDDNQIYKQILKLQPLMNSAQRDALFDQCSLYSTHGNNKVESIAYDSRGTKELIALAGLIVDALYNDKTLIVDEFDDGLHYKIMREIVTLFNNSYNRGAQLLFALQNTDLMDTKTLFRKDQIWLLDREKAKKKNKEPIISIYRLDEFKSLGDGVRSETDILSKYEEGKLGAIPSPNLYGLTKAISESKYE